MALSSRRSVTIAAGATVTAPHGITGIDDYSKIIVWPMPPTMSWRNLEIISEVTSAGVQIKNSGPNSTTVLIFFFYPHSMLGIDAPDTYLASNRNYLLDYTAYTLTRATPGFEVTSDGYFRPYAKNKIRLHPTLSNMYRFDPIGQHHCGDNGRGLMNRNPASTSWSTYWTAVNCTPSWYSSVGGIWTPLNEFTPVGDQAVECVVTANGDASLSHAAANGGGLTVKSYVVSVYVKLASGVSVPANGVQLQATTDAGGTTVVTKNITPTSSWVRHHLSITPAASPNNKITIVLKLPNATAGDRVMFALPDVIGDGANRDWFSPIAPFPYINLGSTYVQSDGDSLSVPSASVPSQMLGLGGAYGFRWIPPFDSGLNKSNDVTFFSVGDLYHEVLYAPSRDGSIWVRASEVGNANPKIRSQALTFVAGDVIEVIISPTTGKISVSGCSGGGNGLGPISWTPFDGTAGPYVWPAAEMIVGDRVANNGYERGSHMGAGYFSEPFAASVL